MSFVCDGKIFLLIFLPGALEEVATSHLTCRLRFIKKKENWAASLWLFWHMRTWTCDKSCREGMRARDERAEKWRANRLFSYSIMWRDDCGESRSYCAWACLLLVRGGVGLGCKKIADPARQRRWWTHPLLGGKQQAKWRNVSNGGFAPLCATARDCQNDECVFASTPVWTLSALATAIPSPGLIKPVKQEHQQQFTPCPTWGDAFPEFTYATVYWVISCRGKKSGSQVDLRVLNLLRKASWVKEKKS